MTYRDLIEINDELNRIRGEINGLVATFSDGSVSVAQKINNLADLDGLLNQITIQETRVNDVRAEIAAGRLTFGSGSAEENFLSNVDTTIAELRENTRIIRRHSRQTIERAHEIVNNYLNDLVNAEQHASDLRDDLTRDLTSIRDITVRISELVSEYDHLRADTADVLDIINTNSTDFQTLSIAELNDRIDRVRTSIVDIKNAQIRNYNNLAAIANDRITNLRGRTSGLSTALTDRINAALLSNFTIITASVSSYDDNAYRTGMDYERLRDALEETRQLETEIARYLTDLNTTLLNDLATSSSNITNNYASYRENLPLTEYDTITANNNHELAELTRIETAVRNAGMSLSDADRNELNRRIGEYRTQISTLEARVTTARTNVQSTIDNFNTSITDIGSNIADNEGMAIDHLSMDDLNGMLLNNGRINSRVETIRTELNSSRSIFSTAEYDGLIASLDAYTERLTALNERVNTVRARIDGVVSPLRTDIDAALSYIEDAERNFNDTLTLDEINTMIGNNNSAIANIDALIVRINDARAELSDDQYRDFINRTNEYRNRMTTLGTQLNNAQINRQLNDDLDATLSRIATNEALDITSLTPEQITDLNNDNSDYLSEILDITNRLNTDRGNLTPEQITAIENKITDATNRLQALNARINGGARTPEQIHNELDARLNTIFDRINNNEREFESAIALISGTENLPREVAERLSNESSSISRDLARIVLDLNSNRAVLTTELFDSLNTRAETLRNHLTELNERIAHATPEAVLTPADTIGANLDNVRDSITDVETRLNDSITAEELITLSNATIDCENQIMTAETQLASATEGLTDAERNALTSRITEYKNRIIVLNDRTNNIASRVMPEYQNFFRQIDRLKSQANNLTNVLMNPALNSGSVSQNMTDVFTSSLTGISRDIESVRQGIERAYADHNISIEQYQNLMRQVELVNNIVTSGNTRMETFNTLRDEGFLNLLDGNMDSLEQAITSFENDVNTAGTPVVRANRKLLDEKYKRILNKINYLEEELAQERETDEASYETKKARLDSLKNRLNNINERYISKCPLFVKAFRSAKNWFKKHPRIAMIAGGLAIGAATHLLLGPVLYPAIMQGTLMLANKLPLLRPAFVAITNFFGHISGATAGQVVLNGVRFNAWTSATGAIINPTIASTSILKGLAMSGVGTAALLGPAIVMAKKLHKKMKKNQVSTHVRDTEHTETHTDTHAESETHSHRLSVTRNLARRELTNTERRNALLASLTPEERAAIQAELERLSASREGETEGRGGRR